MCSTELRPSALARVLRSSRPRAPTPLHTSGWSQANPSLAPRFPPPFEGFPRLAFPSMLLSVLQKYTRRDFIISLRFVKTTKPEAEERINDQLLPHVC